jgi:DNA topoisomerase-3
MCLTRSTILDAIREVHRAMRNPVLLDMRQAEAVDARMELDLRIGAIFTRFQTLSVQNQFPELGEGLISYGTFLPSVSGN